MSQNKFFGKKKESLTLCLGMPIVFIFLCTYYLFPRYNFEKISIAEGLSQNSIFAILQDSKGFLWFGTEDGLNRYDGYIFKVYKHNPDDPDSLSSSWIRSIYEDHSGTIWIGTQGGGLNKFDRYKETFTHYTQNPSNSSNLNDYTIWTIREEKPGILLLGTNIGLNQFIIETGEISTRFTGPVNEKNDHDIAVKSIVVERPGLYWFGTLGDGLYQFIDGKIIQYQNDPGNPYSLNSNKVQAIFIDSSGVPWIGTEKGLNKFDKRRGIFIDYTKEYSPFLNRGVSINYLTCERNSNILSIGTYDDGLYFFDRETGLIDHCEPIPCNPNTLSSKYIQAIYEDNNEIMWIGTDNGLNKIDKKKQKFGQLGIQPKNLDSLVNKNIWSICKDRFGILWVGTEDGLTCLDRKNNKYFRFHFKNNSLGLDDKKIMSILEDSNGKIWLGTDRDGLFRLDREKETITQFQAKPFIASSLSDSRIHVIFEDTSGTLWLGTSKGLNRFNRLNETFICYKNIEHREDSLSDNYVNVIYEDNTQALWIGTKKGLNLFHPGKDTFSHWQVETNNINSLTNNYISCICESKPGIFWIGTWGGGLNKFDQAQETFEHYLEKDGLPNNFIYSILKDESGCLWMSTNKGIARFDSKNKTFKNYDIGDGLQADEFNAGAYYKSKDMEIFFGGINGFNAFYPCKIIDNPHIPPIVITDIQLFSESDKITARSRLQQSITETKLIRLSYQDTVFTFDFAALDYSNPKKNKYAYKLEGFDRDWNYRDSTRRFATYTNLDPGTYLFRVKGSNNDGRWNEEGTTIKIVIIPPFWKTWWFLCFLLTIFAVLSYIIIGFIKKYITFFNFWKREKYIGKFKLLERIGAGGMGTIYKAQDMIEKSGLVALKVLREELFPDEIHRKRFKREAAIIDQLDHPNIVNVIERGQHQEKLYIVMEYLEGKTLAAKIAEEEKMDFREILDIIFQISWALKKIHSKNIVHRDLKPENIMLIEKDGKRNFVKLLDFGLARVEYQSRITQTGTVLGTVNYMAPEQISHAAYSLATDIYSLGVIFYEMVTGRIPFPAGKLTEIMGKILSEIPTEPILLRHDLPLSCNRLIMHMMEKNNISRPTVADVLTKIEELRKQNL